MDQDLRKSVESAASVQDAIEAVGQLYQSVQREIDRRRPLCVISGRCCRFEEYGHRLFVTTLELAHFLHQHGPIHLPDNWDGTGCPFQQNKLCTVHAIRPFGCRMFFCDATSTQWQNEAYERFHAELKRLHERFEVPYIYMEWRQALRALAGRENR
jgi:Fe-S-cluster containining protein